MGTWTTNTTWTTITPRLPRPPGPPRPLYWRVSRASHFTGSGVSDFLV